MIARRCPQMITLVSPNQSRQAHVAMPISRCDDAAWSLRARPVVMGVVSVNGIDVKGDVRLATAGVRTFPGTPAWSPPT
jgi:hypothetical protein